MRQLPTEDAWFREESAKHFYGWSDEVWESLSEDERARKMVFFREKNLRSSYAKWVETKHFDAKRDNK